MKPASNRIPQEKTQYVYCRDTLLSGVSRKHTGRKKKEVALIQFGVREAKSKKKKTISKKENIQKKGQFTGYPLPIQQERRKKCTFGCFCLETQKSVQRQVQAVLL